MIFSGQVKSIPINILIGQSIDTLYRRNGFLVLVLEGFQWIVGKAYPVSDNNFQIKIQGIKSFYRTTKELKTLVVEYEEDNKIWRLPLHESDWYSVIDNNEVDSNRTIEFEINSDNVDRITAKIIKKTFNREEIPFEAISAVLDYCETNQIYDKLGNYGDFYYKLKTFFDKNNRLTTNEN